MTQSMTAFASQKKDFPEGQATWEIRSVNHRYLEIQMRLPEYLTFLEPLIREHIKRYVSRGKIDCILRFKPASTMQALTINPETLAQLIATYNTIKTQFSDPGPTDLMKVLSFPNVIHADELNSATLETPLLTLLELTLREFQATRIREGKQLILVLQAKIKLLREELKKVAVLIPHLIPKFREKLVKKLEDITPQLDPVRFEQEIVLFSNKIDITEEIDRLTIHLDEVERLLSSGGNHGRRLDFLMQELHREANTLGSKSGETTIIHASVDMKVIIEQMREQIQNLE